jgi:thymidylate synthase (FAD)
MYTEWIWKCDLHNLLNFIEKRSHPNAQYEIVQYANAIYDLIKPIVPVTIEAYEDYRKNAVHLTRLEVEAVQQSVLGTAALIGTENKREQDEWNTKRKALFVRA